MKTFRAIDGRRCVARVTEDQVTAARRLDIVTAIAPMVMIFIFAKAAGMI